MREILFRGKTKNTKKPIWVEGWFCGQVNEFMLSPAEDSAQIIVKDKLDWAEVIPKTVGQYTGLIDQNGEKIFEGDIIEFDTPKPFRPVICKVVWDGLAFAVEFVREHCTDYISGYDGEEMKVIGNIHDNPELLEVENG